MIIDATYKTKDVGISLIGIYGVANIGQRSFKSFLVVFAWTSNEQEATYQWVLEMLKKQVGDELH